MVLLAEAFVSPIPTNASKVRVGEFAEDLARKLGLNPGDALEPIIAQLGGTVVYHNPSRVGSSPPESIRAYNTRRFEIYLPSTTSLERDRFTVAHELGHFFLHYPLILRQNPDACMVATRWVDGTNREQQRAEWEANWFAASFLMPADQFRDAHGSSLGLIRQVAGKFGVSESAAKIRASSLGLT